jgi:hypothetical protein
MRAIFGVLSLLLVLAVVGLLVKKQLASTQQAIPALTLPAPGSAGAEPAPARPVGTVQQQSQQIQQQYRQAIDAAMQQARPMPDEK